MEASIQEYGSTKEPNSAAGDGATGSSRRQIVRTFLPLMGFCFCFQMGALGWAVLLPQYILARLRSDAGNVTGISNVCLANKTDPFYLAEKKLEREASAITSVASLCQGIPACVTVLLYSSLSDRMGRKVTVAIPYVGGSLVGILIVFLVAFDLPFWVYFIASFGLGLSGSSMAMLAGVFASAADVTSRERRSIAIAVIQAFNGLAMLLSNVTAGLWIREAGYVPAIGFMSALNIASGVFLLLMRETWPRERRLVVPREAGRLRSLTNQLQHMQSTLLRSRLRKKRIFILIAAFTLVDLSHTSLQSTLTLYVMGEPFCWGPALIGGFNAFKVAIVMIGATFGIFLLKRCVSDLSLSLLGTASHIWFQFLLGFSSFFYSWIHNVVIAAAVMTGLVAAVPSITLRGLTSALVSADEQGAVFGLLAIGDVVSLSFGPVIMNGIYAATVTSINFFVFFFCAALLSIAMLLLVIYKVFLNDVADDSELERIITSST